MSNRLINIVVKLLDWRKTSGSLAIAILLLFTSYCVDNYPYPLFDDIDFVGFMELQSKSTPRLDDSVLFLNVGFDKALVAVTDEYGDTIGHTVITDRELLLRLLKIARTADYEYFVLDVRFEEGMKTDCDSTLWSTMSSLRNFAYSTHSGEIDATPAQVQQSSAMADYGATLSTGFSRWRYLQHSGKSMPMVMYEALDKGTIEKKGLLYFDRGRLCRNAPFIPMPIDVMQEVDQNGDLKFPLLGGQVMRWYTDDEIADMMKGRIVVVGDFVNDMHETYVGSVAGPVLIYSAYMYLHRGKHLVNWWYVITLLLIYTIICRVIMSGKSLWTCFPRLTRFPLLRFLLSFIGWGIVVNILSIAIYLIFKDNYVTIFPTIAFTLLDYCVELRKA